MRIESDSPALSDAALRLLREDQPSDAEISRAYQRFTRPARRRPLWPLVSRWVIAGLAMGLGVAFGSEGIVRLTRPASSAQPIAERAAVRAARKAAPVRAPLPNPQSDAEAAAPAPPVPLAELKPAPRTNTVGPKSIAVDVDEHAPADRAAWAKAAEGLRNNDSSETQSALAALEHAGSAADREAARLIRAQLMLHQGDARGARALLQDLADHAQSAAVRAKAHSLLSTQANSALNTAPSGTQ